MNKLMIIGAGGHSSTVIDIAGKMKKWHEIVILDDFKIGEFMQCEIVDTIDQFKKYINTHNFFVAIGNNKMRAKIFKQISDAGGHFANIISPNSVVSRFSTMGNGNYLGENVVINANVNIGDNNIINTNVSIDHDCIINNSTHLSPGVILGGNVSVDDFSWLGLGSNVINNIVISRNVTIGAGTTVLKNVDKNEKVVGTPHKVIGFNER